MTAGHAPPNPSAIETDKRPFVLIWEVTQACELACDHCRASADPNRHPGELSTAEGKRLLDAAARFGEGQLVVLSGGDPMKRDDLIDLVRYGTRQGLRMTVTPSGTEALTSEHIAAIGVLGTFLVLSIAAVLASDLIERLLPAVELFVGLLLIGLGVAVFVGYTGSVHVSLPERRSSVLGFGLFGALYALAATACVLPLFLAVALQSLTLSKSGTAVVLGSYAGSFGALMIVATVATAVGHDALVGRVSDRIQTLRRLAGGVLIAAGLGQIYLAVVL
jgi:cytochrome c-type biogenesis protein